MATKKTDDQQPEQPAEADRQVGTLGDADELRTVETDQGAENPPADRPVVEDYPAYLERTGGAGVEPAEPAPVEDYPAYLERKGDADK